MTDERNVRRLLREWEDRAVTEYWHSHYVEDGRCALCGNAGAVRATLGRERWCICPNGQAGRALSGKEGP